MAFEDLENFLTEGMLMLDFQHKNVMTLIGVVYENGGRPQVVLPYMDNGDLCTLIRKEDVVGQLCRFDNVQSLTTIVFIDLSQTYIKQWQAL